MMKLAVTGPLPWKVGVDGLTCAAVVLMSRPGVVPRPDVQQTVWTLLAVQVPN